MAETLHILHLEENELDAESVSHALKATDFHCLIDRVDNFAAYQQALSERDYDLILADFALSDCDGVKTFAEAKKLSPQTPYILVTGAIGEEPAVDMIKTGVTDYVLKTKLARLQTAVPKALEAARVSREKQQATDALWLSKERFDLAVCGSGAGVWDWADVTNEQMWWSPRIYAILGLAEDELPATCGQIYARMHPDDVAIARQAIRNHFAEQKPYDVEFRLRHKQGHFIWIRSRGRALVAADGTPLRMAGYVQDVSDRKVAQTQLLEREKDLLRAQEVAKIGVWSLDIPQNRLRWTAETYRIFGVENRNDFAGTVESLDAYVHPDDRAFVAEKWRQALAGAGYDIEHRIIAGNGQVKYVREVAEVEFDAAGRPLRGIGVVHDLTRQRRAEEEQRKTDEKYRIISSTAREAFVMIDSAGKVTLWNPAAEKIFGYTAEEMLGQAVHQVLVPGKLRSLAIKGLSHFHLTGEGAAVGEMMELEGLTKQGKLVPLEISLNRVRHDDEWQAIGVLRDISERKEAEAERQALEQQLRQTQKMEAIGTLAGGIAHDFNNILASIIGYTSMVERRLEPGSRDQLDLQEVLNAADRAKLLVRQILTFSRKSEQAQKPVHLDRVVREVQHLIRASLPSTIEIVTRLQTTEKTILGDATQIHQVLMNLCTNAYHAMPDGGTLTITLEKKQLGEENPWELRSGGYLQLLVTDTGRGISPDVIDKIFDPYFTTKDIDTGTGLGLSVVCGIVIGAGGFIDVESVLGEGTRFRILLPVYQPLAKTAADEKVTAVTGGSEHILFVDDEVNLARLGRDFLEDLGYRVTIQTSSLAALQQVKSVPQAYDLLVTDQTMPRMTGIELAKQLYLITPKLPVILCSGLTYSLETEGVSETAICKVLVKTELLDCLPQLLREVFDR
ncbi:MAG: PAS domain-containing protein [Deltaproteobacteria bacterium]|nr:PAS domain-containing protein [Deltaproteobacteria bacterium]